MKWLVSTFVALICVGLDSLLSAQLPPGAKISKEVEIHFAGEPSAVRVLFYQASNRLAGVAVSSLHGEVLASESVDSPTLLDQTGVYDVTGTGHPQVILHTGIGQASELRIFTFENRHLHKIFDWSGSSCTVIQIGGRHLLALKDAPYGTLTNLYEWQDGVFRKVNERFAEFYTREIQDQVWFIETSEPFIASQFSRACSLAAQGLLYQKKYDEATRVCEEAYATVESGGRVVPSQTGETPERVSLERSEAEKAIQGTLASIASAEQ